MKTVRWTARVISLVLLVFLGLSFAGSLGHETLQPGDAERLAALAVMMAGMVISWRWERLGGGLVIGAFLVQIVLTPRVISLGAMWLFPLVGLLFLASGVASAAAARPRTP